MQAHDVTRLVRVPWNEPGIIGKVLDAGAYGVICPMINTKAQAEAFVSACKYPPQGTRSNGPIRVAMYGAASSYQKTANDEILVIPMIETREALDNLEAILDVERLLRETQKRGIHAGIHCGAPEYAVRMLKMGFRLVTIANDSGLLALAARRAIAEVWKGADDLR
jgi:4-hydroxy-2-oxoheptanedioate aldolase